MSECDLLVIGAGSGGVRAARLAAAHGWRVVVAECSEPGGTCVNLGCIPKKLLHYGAEYAEEWERAAAYGWQLPAAPRLHWATLRDNKDREIRRLNGVYRELLDKAGAQLVQGQARIQGPHTVRIGTTTRTARHILVATGSEPWVPEVQGSEHVVVSDALFSLPELPARAIIVGGGYIAIEFACILKGLGVDTTLVYRGPLPLRDFDTDLREFLLEQLLAQGIHLCLNTEVAAITANGDGSRTVQLGDRTLSAELVLYALGRRPRTHGLGLEELGVELSADGAVLVNEFFQSSVPSIYAIGDAIGRARLTPVALAEAGLLVRSLIGAKPCSPLDYDSIPTAVFSRPHMAVTGLNETRARQQHGEIVVRSSVSTPLRYTLGGPPGRALLKIIATTDGRLVGAGMVGPEAGEIMQALAVALRAGATLDQLGSTLSIHPTLAEEFINLGNVPYKPMPPDS